MLNRRILRIKAFKAVYSFAENPDLTLKEIESGLDVSCESTRNLYLFMLSVIGPLTVEASARIEAVRSKFNPSEEELNPNMKFVGNSLAPFFAEDPDFTKILKKKKLSWEQYDVFIRHLYESVRKSDYFKAYMENGERSLADDCRLFTEIFEKEFVGNKELEEILEDLSIYWNDDLAYSLSWCCRSLEAIGKGASWNLPDLYMSDITKSKESDKRFVTEVVRKACLNFESYYDLVAGNCSKWNKDRICVTDLALIICGLAESEVFPGIGYKTTINEYVEISKYYSTPESSAFVNGLLDKLINK